MTPEQLHAAGLARLPDGAECFIDANGLDPEGRPCDGRLQACHVIPKRILYGPAGVAASRRVGITPADLVADHRNGIRNCQRHHGLLDGGSPNAIVVDPEDLPTRVWVFCRQFGFVDLMYALHVRRLQHASGHGSDAYNAGTPSGHG